jgi:hypothetical protein
MSDEKANKLKADDAASEAGAAPEPTGEARTKEATDVRRKGQQVES